MLNNLITLANFKFFVEFFFITSGILLTIIFTVLKTRSVVKFEIHKPLSNCISLIFLMGAYLIVNESNFLLNFNNTNLELFYATISSDNLGVFVKFLVCVFSSIFFYIIADFIYDQKLEGELLLILYFAMVGLVLLSVCNDLMSSYLAIELVSLSSYLLASFKKESSYSIEAGLKYFVMGSISSAFFLLGSSLIYASTGTIFFVELHHLFADLEGEYYDPLEDREFYIYARAGYLLREQELIPVIQEFETKKGVIKSDVISNCKKCIELDQEKKKFRLVYGDVLSDRNYNIRDKQEMMRIATLQIRADVALQKIILKQREVKQEFLKNLANLKLNTIEFAKIQKELKYLKSNWLYDLIHSDLDSLDFVQPTYCFSIDHSTFKLVELGILFILFSIFIKLALAPFHLWSLDVYEGSPTISTFFFAVMSKLSLFMFLIRFCYTAMPTFITEWQFYSMWIAIISLFVGSFGGLKQRKLKTLLAYSSINHMGYSLLAFSINSFFGLKILIIYLIIYMLSGVCIWFSILLLKLKKRKTKFSKELSDLSLLGKSNPALAFSLSITFFSIAGLPPFIGFITKIGVFLALLQEELYFFCILAVLCSVISTFYYIRIVKTMFFENILVGKLYYPIQSNKVWVLSFFTFLLLFLFINPKVFFLLVHIIVQSN